MANKPIPSNEEITVSFTTSQFKQNGEKWAVFFFYTGDFNETSRQELHDLSKNYEKFRQISCRIFAISCDSATVHKAWLNKENLKFPFLLLADPSHVLAKNFQVLIEDKGIPYQSTFIVNPCGKIVNYEILTHYDLARNPQTLTKRVENLQSRYRIIEPSKILNY